MRPLLCSLFLFLSGCASLSPAEWPPSGHIHMQKQCRVACYPGMILSYEAMNARCTCRGGEK